MTFICRERSALARRSVIVRARAFFAAMSLALAATIPVAQAQPLPPSPAEPGSQTVFGALPGRWVRPDGGYVIGINAVDDNGKLDASYSNPRPLPFYTAAATRDGPTLKLFFELRVGGYNGSTYTLSYDPASDQLKGVYYQAVAKQKFDVVFHRAKP